MELSDQERTDIYEEVKRMANTYFDMELPNIYKKELKIEFYIAEFERKPQAYAEKAQKIPNSYNITISAGMLYLLIELAEKLSDDTNFIRLINPIKGKRKLIRNMLFYSYVDFIICHEWSHILCGHLDFKNVNQHDFLKSFKNGYNLNKTFELEADSKAATFTLARLANNCKHVDEILFGSVDKSRCGSTKTWDYSIYAILSLFDYFENNFRKENITHPKPSYRIFVSIMFIAGEVAEKKGIRNNLPFISDEEDKIYAYFLKLYLRFNENYKGINLESILLCLNESYEYCSDIGTMIKKSGINDYRKINARWV